MRPRPPRLQWQEADLRSVACSLLLRGQRIGHPAGGGGLLSLLSGLLLGLLEKSQQGVARSLQSTSWGGSFTGLEQALAGCNGWGAHWQARGKPLQDAPGLQGMSRCMAGHHLDPVAPSPSTCSAQGHPASSSCAETGLPH